MKNILTTIGISLIISFITTQAISFFDLPFWQSYSGQIVKDTSTKVIQEKIEEFKKINNIESDVTAAINLWAPSVVSIITSRDLAYYINDALFYGATSGETTTTKLKNQKLKTWWASWIIISKDWYILTNKHVVDDTTVEYTVITNDWDTLSVKNIRRDPLLDIAVLQVINTKWELPTDLQPAKFISYKSPVNVGQFTIAIWNALTEYSNSATFGIISAKNRSLSTQWLNDIYIGLYQTDTPIHPGNSGWPLLNTAWEVLGINTALSQWESIWFALPLSSEFIQTTLASLQTGWTIARPYIWMQTKLLTKAAAKNLDMKKFEWVYIESVQLNSPAKVAWLLSWDVITEINNTTIQSDMPLLYTLYTFKPTDTLSLLVYRNKEYQKIELTLGSLWDIVQ